MTMTREKLIEETFAAAAELSSEARVAYLDATCAGDAALRREVEALLTADTSAQSFLERPAVET